MQLEGRVAKCHVAWIKDKSITLSIKQKVYYPLTESRSQGGATYWKSAEFFGFKQARIHLSYV
jgi:hypothetical protein